jgi:hypothetical protein
MPPSSLSGLRTAPVSCSQFLDSKPIPVFLLHLSNSANVDISNATPFFSLNSASLVNMEQGTVASESVQLPGVLLMIFRDANIEECKSLLDGAVVATANIELLLGANELKGVAALPVLVCSM